MRVMTFLMACAALLAVRSTATAAAVPRLYSALNCRVASGTAEYALGSIRNPSATQPLLLDCPLVVDLDLTGTLHVTAVVSDRHSSQNVQCQLIAVTTT